MIAYRRRLPHLHPDGAVLFLTWLPWGSLPRMANSFIDGEPRIADVVANAILIGERERGFYELLAWTVTLITCTY